MVPFVLGFNEPRVAQAPFSRGGIEVEHERIRVSLELRDDEGGPIGISERCRAEGGLRHMPGEKSTGSPHGADMSRLPAAWLSALFEPYRLSRRLTLKNRIVQAPCTRKRADPDLAPTKGAIDYYAS